MLQDYYIERMRNVLENKRKELGLSYGQIGAKAGIAKGSVYKILADENTKAPTFVNVLKIASALDVDPREFTYTLEPFSPDKAIKFYDSIRKNSNKVSTEDSTEPSYTIDETDDAIIITIKKK